MPLNPDAAQKVRQNLERISNGEKVRPVSIGALTDEQLAAMNAVREARTLPKVESSEVLFHGTHVYKSRIVQDGYTLDDVVLQITHAMEPTSRCKAATSIESAELREDGYGNSVRDQAVFECTARRPRLELFSAIPRGDHRKPADVRAQEKGRPKAASVDS